MSSEEKQEHLPDDRSSSPVQLEDIRLAEAASNSPVNLPDEPSDGVESSPQQQASENVVIRVAKETSLRRLINYVIYQIEQRQTVTIQALHVCVHKAVMLAGIVRDRVGNVHMLNSLLVVNEKRATTKANENSEGQEQSDTRKSEKTLTGIQIILSLNQLDDTQLGYQRPKPAGFASFGIRRPMNPRRETYRPRPRLLEDEQHPSSDSATRSKAPRGQQPQTENHEARAARPRQERRQKPKKEDENDVQEGEEVQEQKRRKNRKTRRSAAKKTQEKETSSAEEKPAEENSQRERAPRNKRAMKEQSDSAEESNGNAPARGPTSQNNQSGEYHYDSNNYRRGDDSRRSSGYEQSQRLYENHRQYNERRPPAYQQDQYRYQNYPAGRRGRPSYGLQSQGSGHYRPQTNYGAYDRQNYGYSTSYHNQRYQDYGYQGSDQRRPLQRYSDNNRQSGYLQGARNPRKPNEIEDFYSPNGGGASTSTHQRRVTAVQYPRE